MMKNIFCLISCLVFSVSCASQKKGVNVSDNRDTSNDTKPIEPMEKSEEQNTDRPGTLFGHKTNYGDWTFAEKGRNLLKESLAIFKAELSYLTVNQLIQQTNDEVVKVMLKTDTDYINLLKNAAESVVLPSNEELYKMLIKNQLFEADAQFKVNYKLHANLDFFVTFGRTFNDTQRVMAQYRLKKIFIEAIFTNLNVQSAQVKELSRLFVDAQLIDFEKNVANAPFKELIKDQVKLEKMIQIMRIMTTYQLHKVTMGPSQKIYNEIKVWPSLELNRKEHTIHYHDLSCFRNGEYTTVDCNVNERVEFRIEAPIYWKKNNEIIKKEIIEIYSKFELKPGKVDGFFDYRFYAHFNTNRAEYNSEDFYGEMPLKSDYYNKLTEMTFDFKNQYSIASQLFSQAQNELIDTLRKVDVQKFANILTSYNKNPAFEKLDAKNQALTFIEHVGRIKNLSFEEVKSMPLKIKNLNYKPDLSQVFLEAAYYFNYGVNSMGLEFIADKIELKKLIIHEIGHLYGLDDSIAAKMNYSISYLLEKIPLDKQLSAFIQLNAEQLPFHQIIELAQNKTKEIIDLHHDNLKEFLGTKGYKIRNQEKMIKISEKKGSCWFQFDNVPCTTSHNKTAYRYEVTIDFQLEDQTMVQSVLPIDVYIDLVSTQSNHGLIEYEFVSRPKKYYSVVVLDAKTQKTIDEFDITDNEAVKQKVFWMDKVFGSEIILQKF